MFSLATSKALEDYSVKFEFDIEHQRLNEIFYSNKETLGSLNVKKSILDLINTNHLAEYEVCLTTF